MPRGGFRAGAGRPAFSEPLVRMTPQIEESFLGHVDQALDEIWRRGVRRAASLKNGELPPPRQKRADFLRRSLAALVAHLEGHPEEQFQPPTAEGALRAFPLKIPAELAARARTLVATGRVKSFNDLVRAAAIEESL